MRRFLFSTMKLMGCVWVLWLVHNSLISNYIKLTPFVPENCIRLRILKFQFDFHVIFPPFFFWPFHHLTLFSILCSFFLLYPISLLCRIYSCFFLSCVLISLMCYYIFITFVCPLSDLFFHQSFFPYFLLGIHIIILCFRISRPHSILSLLFLLSLQPSFCPVHSKWRSFSSISSFPFSLWLPCMCWWIPVLHLAITLLS